MTTFTSFLSSILHVSPIYTGHNGKKPRRPRKQENVPKIVSSVQLRQKLESYECREKDLLEETWNFKWKSSPWRWSLPHHRGEGEPTAHFCHQTNLISVNLSPPTWKLIIPHHLITSLLGRWRTRDLEVRTSTSTSSSSVHDFEEEDNRSSHSLLRNHLLLLLNRGITTVINHIGSRSHHHQDFIS